MDKTEKKRLAILRILHEADRPLGGSKITEQLQAMGHEVSERTVRYYLLGMDNEGMTKSLGKRGRLITDEGLQELNNSHVIDKVGFLAAKIDRMTYRMDFDLKSRKGTVVVNASLVARERLPEAVPLMSRVFEAGYSMGPLVGLIPPGERLGEMTVPSDMVGIVTVCSITLNGLLLSHGIPTHSRFGGLLELRANKPTRFTAIITYEGTSLDPLEVFIRSGMTDYAGATSKGSGRIGVGFREVPAESRDSVIALALELEKVGLGGFYKIGYPGQPLLEIPVSEGLVGIIVIGGLNPMAILEEHEIKVRSWALAALIEYGRLFHYGELAERAAAIS